MIKNANGEILAICKPTNGVYKLGKSSEMCMMAKNTETSALTWHRRLGHMNLRTMEKMKANNTGVDFKNDEKLVMKCEICSQAKSCRLPFKMSESRSSGILELIHSDVMGPMEIIAKVIVKT